MQGELVLEDSEERKHSRVQLLLLQVFAVALDHVGFLVDRLPIPNQQLHQVVLRTVFFLRRLDYLRRGSDEA